MYIHMYVHGVYMYMYISLAQTNGVTRTCTCTCTLVQLTITQTNGVTRTLYMYMVYTCTCTLLQLTITYTNGITGIFSPSFFPCYVLSQLFVSLFLSSLDTLFWVLVIKTKIRFFKTSKDFFITGTEVYTLYYYMYILHVIVNLYTKFSLTLFQTHNIYIRKINKNLKLNYIFQ